MPLPCHPLHCCSTPAHCIEYAHLIKWNQERTGEEFDTDNEEHMRWVYDNALERAKQYGIAVRHHTGARCWHMLGTSISMACWYGSPQDPHQVVHAR